jgi:hypothetical protein
VHLQCSVLQCTPHYTTPLSHQVFPSPALTLTHVLTSIAVKQLGSVYTQTTLQTAQYPTCVVEVVSAVVDSVPRFLWIVGTATLVLPTHALTVRCTFRRKLVFSEFCSVHPLYRDNPATLNWVIPLICQCLRDKERTNDSLPITQRQVFSIRFVSRTGICGNPVLPDGTSCSGIGQCQAGSCVLPACTADSGCDDGSKCTHDACVAERCAPEARSRVLVGHHVLEVT